MRHLRRMATAETTFVNSLSAQIRTRPPVPPTSIQAEKEGGYATRRTMMAKQSAELLQRVASQMTKAFSHCHTSLESFLKAKWHMIRPPAPPTISTHVYEVRPRADKHGVDLISDAFRFGALWYAGPNAVSNAIGFAKHRSRSHDAVIHVYDEAGNVIETHEHKGEFKEW